MWAGLDSGGQFCLLYSNLARSDELCIYFVWAGLDSEVQQDLMSYASTVGGLAWMVGAPTAVVELHARVSMHHCILLLLSCMLGCLFIVAWERAFALSKIVDTLFTCQC